MIQWEKYNAKNEAYFGYIGNTLCFHIEKHGTQGVDMSEYKARCFLPGRSYYTSRHRGEVFYVFRTLQRAKAWSRTQEKAFQRAFNYVGKKGGAK